MIRMLICTILFFAMLESVLAGYVPKAFLGEFVQTKKSIISGNIETDISLKYQFKGNVYMHSKGDDDEKIYVCNPEKVWIYTPPLFEGEKGEVLIGNSSVHCLSKIFDKLSFGLKSNSEYKVKKLSDKVYELRFSEANEKRLGYYRFELNYNNKEAKFSQLESMKMFTRNDKNPTVLTTKKLNVKKGFKASTFRFTPPKNTNKNFL